jgi:7-keto-8-aminopelargonate synthetase-like enzyme
VPLTSTYPVTGFPFPILKGITMLRPIPLSLQAQDLLTRSADPSSAQGQRLQDQRGTREGEAASGLPLTGAFQDGAARFLAPIPTPTGRSFVPQDPLGFAPRARIDGLDGAAVTRRVEGRLARLLQLPAVTCLPSMPATIRTALGAALQPGDTVILDHTLFSAMSETVLALNARPLRTPRGSVQGVERRLRRLSATRRFGRLWVAVAALCPQTSTVAEVADLADLCQHYNAGLIVDVSQDLGLVGPDGGGVMEVQGCLGRADLVIGCFARAFGAPGGFVASTAALGPRLQQGRTRKPDISQMATVLAALDLIDSVEGQRRRFRLHALCLRLRNHLMADGVPVLGQASPVVPVRLAPRTAQTCNALMHSAGINVRLLQDPLVARHAPRWCLHLTADHSPADIDTLADLIRDVTRSVMRG